MKRSKFSNISNKRPKCEEEEHSGNFQTPASLPSGRIKKLVLRNFMCHRFFEIKFPCNRNLIVGSNGSGKSAILVALVIGLGGKATDTKRGSSVKSLISNGCTKSIIEVTLGNDGAFSYKNNEFGSEIRVARTLTESSSTYKLYSAAGKLVSCKKQDLDHILHFFRIQVNNPLVILNQDTARTFLKSAKPSQLFNLFCQGTQIEELAEKCYQLVSHQPRIAAMFNQKKEEVVRACREIERNKEKIEKAKELRACEEETHEIEMEIFWARVTDLNKNKKLASSKIEEEEKIFEELENQIKEKESIRNALAAELKSLQEDVSRAVGENEKFERLMACEKKSMEEVKRKMKILQCAEVDTRKEEEKHKKSLANFEKALEKRRAEQGEKEAQMRQLEEKKRKLMVQIEEANAVYKTHSVQQQHLTDTLSVESENYGSAQRYYQNLKRTIEFKEQQLNAIKREKSELCVYGKHIRSLVEKIDEAYELGLLSKKPRGPLGRYIQVEDDSWAAAVENFVGRKTLTSFCVDNSADLSIVKNIVKRLGIPEKDQPSFTVTKFFNQIHDVTNNEVHCQFLSLLRGVKISDPVVANVLIDQLSIERVILTPTSSDAYPLMDSIERVPINCKRAITKTGDLFYPAPGYRVYSGKITSVSLLKTSVEQTLRTLSREIEGLEEKLKEAENQAVETKNLHETAKSNLDKAKRETYQLLVQIEKLKKRISDISQYEMDDHARGAEMLSKEIEGLTRSLEKNSNKRREIQEQLKTTEASIRAYQEKILMMNEERKEIATLAATGPIDIAKRKEKMGSILSGEIVFRRERSLKSLEVLGKKLVSISKELDIALKEAKEACPEIEKPRALKNLENDLRILQKRKVVLQEFLGGTGIEFSLNFMKALTELENLQRFMDKIEGLTNLLSSEINRRNDRLRAMKMLIGSRVNKKFNEFLSLKKFEGKIEVSYSNRELLVTVKPNSVSTVSTMDSLSGGERSFSMVSFLLALWNWVDHPFYYIDEFDVFMDEVSRKKSLSLLTTYAKANPKRQFTFLTPHSIELTKRTDIDVFRMNDPERRL